MKFSPDMLPPTWQTAYAHWPSDDKKAWEADRLRGQIDHMYLANEIFGWDFVERPHGGPDGLFSNFVQKDPKQEKLFFDLDATKKRMVLWTRGVYKTTSVVVEMAQLILNYPNIRILYVSGSMDLARRQLNRLKAIFESPNKRFASLYPDFVGKKLGNMSQFTVPNRTNTVIAEPTVTVSTARAMKASSHFDIIFVDDLVNEVNSKNFSQLESSWDDYNAIAILVEPAGYLVVTGTRYNFNDAYQKIYESALQEIKAKGKSAWKISIRGAYSEICATCQHPKIRHDQDKSYAKPPCTMTGCECTEFIDSHHKELLFPAHRTRDGRFQGHTLEFLESEQTGKEEFFANQYMCQIMATGAQAFTPEILNKQTLMHLSQIPEHGAMFIVGDLSYLGGSDVKRLRDKDKSVLYVCRAIPGNVFVIDCAYGKWGALEMTHQLLRLVMKYRPAKIWLERFNGWEAYDIVIKSEATQRNILELPLDWIKMNMQAGAKLARIGSIQAYLDQRKLWLFGGMPGYHDLCDQLKKWPKSLRFDDFADCLGHVCNVPTGMHLEKSVQTKESAMDFILQLRAPQEETGYSSGPLGTGLLG